MGSLFFCMHESPFEQLVGNYNTNIVIFITLKKSFSIRALMFNLFELLTDLFCCPCAIILFDRNNVVPFNVLQIEGVVLNMRRNKPSSFISYGIVVCM